MEQNNSFHDLLLKAERFCSYQERCRFELQQKLKEWGADEDSTSKVIASLEENEYMNDERFAKLFASGKFRIKRWGKNKIRAELRMKKIPDAFIKKGLDAIDESEYKKTIQHLIGRKAKELKGQTTRDEKAKIVRYLLSKGFESSLVFANLKLET